MEIFEIFEGIFDLKLHHSELGTVSQLKALQVLTHLCLWNVDRVETGCSLTVFITARFTGSKGRPRGAYYGVVSEEKSEKCTCGWTRSEQKFGQ